MEDEKGCFISIIMLIGYVIAVVGSGTIAWNVAEPFKGFADVLLFIIVWGVLGYAFSLIVAGLITLIGEI